MISATRSIFVASLLLPGGRQALGSVAGRCGLCHEVHKQINLRHIDVIREMTGAPEDEIVDKLRQNLELQLLNEKEIKIGLLKLKELGIKQRNRLDLLRLLKLHPVTVQNRTKVLLEAGFGQSRITTSAIMKYLALTKLKVEELKKKNYIGSDTNVAHHMMGYLDLPVTGLDDDTFDENNDIITIKMKVLQKYLQEKLDVTKEQFQQNKFSNRLKHKCLRTICQNIHLAKDVIGISVTRLRSNPFLLVLNPENTLEILEKLGNIGGVDVRHAINTHPKILVSTCENLKQIRNHLKDHNIPNEAVLRCIEVFTLSSDTVRNRLEELETNEFFAACRQNPRVLELVIYQRKAVERLSFLNDKLQFTTLNTIASHQKAFDRFCEVGGAERPKGFDHLHFLGTELNADKAVLRHKLKRHPYWAYVPLIQVGRNLTLLRDMGFSNDAILKDVYILLYPTEKIVSELEALRKQKREELDCCRTEGGRIRPELLLQLAIYYIEKEFNFNGEAVWTGETLNVAMITD